MSGYDLNQMEQGDTTGASVCADCGEGIAAGEVFTLHGEDLCGACIAQVRYVVVENTPGYLPDDDDPATFADLDDARVYASDLLSRLLDHIYDGQSCDDDPAGFTVHGSFQTDRAVIVYDNARQHDLGRVIEILDYVPEGGR